MVVDGVNQGVVSAYVFTNITSNHAIGAYFSINTYTVTASASAGGAISPSGAQTVAHGDSIAFAVVPDPGHHVDSVVVDGVSQGAITGYTFTNVTSNHSITAYFSVDTYTITATAGANGSVFPSGSVVVNHGSSQSFTVTPDAGYYTDSILVDGARVDSTASYTFVGITGNHTIQAFFSINVYAITATA